MGTRDVKTIEITGAYLQLNADILKLETLKEIDSIMSEIITQIDATVLQFIRPLDISTQESPLRVH